MLLLRASSEVAGKEVDLRAVVDGDRAAASGVAHASALVALADAIVADDEAALRQARARVLEEMGPQQLVDAAAVASNFERMVRIADATGIALDDPVEILTSDIRAELGIDRFTAAANTPRPGRLRRLLTPLLRPVLARALRLLGSR